MSCQWSISLVCGGHTHVDHRHLSAVEVTLGMPSVGQVGSHQRNSSAPGLQRVIISRTRDVLKGVICVTELPGADRRLSGTPCFGHHLIAEHHAENAASRRRIAVGILTCARRYLDCTAEVAAPIQEPESNVSIVQQSLSVLLSRRYGPHRPQPVVRCVPPKAHHRRPLLQHIIERPHPHRRAAA